MPRHAQTVRHYSVAGVMGARSKRTKTARPHLVENVYAARWWIYAGCEFVNRERSSLDAKRFSTMRERIELLPAVRGRTRVCDSPNWRRRDLGNAMCPPAATRAQAAR
jgi:hypothetical protein